MKVALKPMPDGFGITYGRAWRGDDHYTINVLPPKGHWHGEFELDGCAPRDTDWVCHVDGEEAVCMADQPSRAREFTKLLQGK